MYLTGHYSKVNFRRFYESIRAEAQTKDGHAVNIYETRETDTKGKKTNRIIYTDNSGHARRKVIRENGRLISDEVFGEYTKIYDKGKVVTYTRYASGSLQCKQGLCTDKTELLFGEKINLSSWYSKGSLYKQIAYYTNNRKAYQYSKGSKKTMLLYRRSGEVWAEYTGAPIAWSPRGCIFNAGSRYYWHAEEEQNKKRTPVDITGSGSFALKVYDIRGKIIHSGQYERSQRIGVWLEDSINTYYLTGVKVSENIYRNDPSKWNADEVLAISNAQLRASLLKKFTYERLIQRKKGRIVDHDTTNDRDNTIIEFDNAKGSGDDRFIRILKVCCPTTRAYYALRIPPEISNCEVARSWTFNRDLDDNGTITDADLVKFMRET